MLKPLITLAVLALSSAVLAQPSDLFVYPAAGQSPEQTAKDKAECDGWARQQVAPPPASAPPAQTSSGPDGSVIRGAARGAILGEVLDDDAGKGAAAGALIGGMRRADRRRANRAQQKQQQQEQAAAQQQYSEEITRAYRVCLEARSYTVG